MDARLVYDGSGPPRVPPSMGTPCEDQLVGTDLENLGELASRVCYDSLGYGPDGRRLGRPSAALHQHILEVKNLSVYEHCVFTVRFPYQTNVWPIKIAATCLNRKGTWVEVAADGSVEITANFRAVLEWRRHSRAANNNEYVFDVGKVLRDHAGKLAPIVMGHPTFSPYHMTSLKEADDLTDDQAHVSIWMSGSRGFTHEQVRHRFAMSQRSTRYCDEGESPYVVHPLIARYFDDGSVPEREKAPLREAIESSAKSDRVAYGVLVEALQDYLTGGGVDRLAARKYARGAARGYLGNALESEMIFTAPVSAWKWMLIQRMNPLADAEIRTIYARVLDALKSSRYADRFRSYIRVPGPDGLGDNYVRVPGPDGLGDVLKIEEPHA